MIFWRKSKRINGHYFPAAVRVGNTVLELGKTQYLPLFARQVVKSNILSIWRDGK